MEATLECPSCKMALPADSYFCPNCGRKFRDKPPATGVWPQLKVYALSLFLPPLGVWPAVKYLRQPDPASRRIGIICLVLTAVSILLTVWYTSYVINGTMKAVNQQLNEYQNIGM